MAFIQDFVTFVTSFDIFGESFTFKIKKRKYYTSFFGGFTSLAFVIYSLYYLFFNLTDFFRKNNRTTEDEVKIEIENKINFKDHQDFIMFFCLRNSKMQIDENLINNLQINSIYNDDHINNSIFTSNQTSLDLNSCSNEEIKNSFGELFNLNDYSQCKCLNMSTQKDLSNLGLRTKFHHSDRSYIHINMNRKNNLIDTNNLDIDDYLRKTQSKLFLHFPSFYIDSKDLVYPVKKNIHTEVYNIKSNTEIEAHLDLSVIHFFDYSSLVNDGNFFKFKYFYLKIILDLFNKTTKIIFDNKDSLSYYRPSNNTGDFLRIDLELNMKQRNFYRNVLRYDDFLGNLVGYLSNIIIILYFFNTYYNSFRAKVYFSEKFFIKNNFFQTKILEEISQKISKIVFI